MPHRDHEAADMGLKTNKLAAATTIAAAFSMLATPVAAAELPTPAHAKAYDASVETAQNHRWGRYRDRIDAGDVLTGVLILGGIAAIASAANRGARERDGRYPERYPDRWPDEGDARYRTPGDYDRSESRGLDRAVDMCVAEVEQRSGRVGTVDGANRDRDGWQVSGELENGRAYSCRIGNDGRISDVDVGDYRESSADPDDGQWSDEDYARARETQSVPPPLPEPEAADDGRYSLSQAPDFD